MFRIISIYIFVLLLPLFSLAQLMPRDGSVLNYRIIGFKFPEVKKGSYVLEIAKGTHFIEDSFKNRVIIRQPSAKNQLIVEVPSFGRDYTWRVISTDSAKKVTISELHHFSTLEFRGVDTNLNRLRVINPATKYKDAYVFLEANRALYDMNGRPVWFLPRVDELNTDYIFPADLQITPTGSITFIYQNYAAYEVDYNGKILFRTPKRSSVNKDTIEHFHHEFRKLSNGNYMIMGSDIGKVDRSFAAKDDSSSLWFPAYDEPGNPLIPFQEVPFATFIEYDKKGKVVWSWHSAPYFKSSDIFNHIGKRGNIEIGPHVNSFYFDEKGKAIYFGCRDISRIIKISYPEGKVLKEYGEKFVRGLPEQGNGLFCKQHSVKLSSGGNLYMYNNNACDLESFPSVVMLSTATGKNGEMKKLWEYKCPIEGETGTKQTKYQFVHGGNVQELPDHSIFTSMSTLYSRVFIVSPDKKLLWSAIPERWNKDLKKWELVFQYKASIIASRNELEKLIWNQEGN